MYNQFSLCVVVVGVFPNRYGCYPCQEIPTACNNYRNKLFPLLVFVVVVGTPFGQTRSGFFVRSFASTICLTGDRVEKAMVVVVVVYIG